MALAAKYIPVPTALTRLDQYRARAAAVEPGFGGTDGVRPGFPGVFERIATSLRKSVLEKVSARQCCSATARSRQSSSRPTARRRPPAAPGTPRPAVARTSRPRTED